MNRETGSDFEELRKFLHSYSLGSVLQNGQFEESLKRLHRKYLACLIVLAEMEAQSAHHSDLPLGEALAYLKESVSELGCAFFCWMHGIYKTSRQCGRSAIETAVKGAIVAEVPEAPRIKSLYEVFAVAKSAKVFVVAEWGEILLRLHALYGELCADVHTATVDQMQHIGGFAFFPQFEPVEGNRARDLLEELGVLLCLVLLHSQPKLYFRMHHRNQIIVLRSLPRARRHLILSPA